MLDQTAIQELAKAQAITAATAAIGERIDSASGALALPDDFKLHDLEQYQPTRRRARGAMDTSSIGHFAHYVSDYAEDGAAVFVDAAAMKAVAVLNLGTPNAPGHADNIASLTMRRTAPYEALRRIADGSPHSQTAVAEFLEDWLGGWRCFGDEGDEPAPDIPPKRAIDAVRRITIEGQRKVESTTASLNASLSTFDAVKAHAGQNQLPSFITFTCEPFAGLAMRVFGMRLGILTGGKEPQIVLRIQRKEEHEEQMADELANVVRGAIHARCADPSIPVHLGTYKRLP